jgi:hypothetical protein
MAIGDKRRSKKIKVKVKVKFTLEKATNAQRGSRCITTLSLTSAIDGSGWSRLRSGRFISREIEPVPIVQEAGWAPGPIWTGAVKFCRKRNSIQGPSIP